MEPTEATKLEGNFDVVQRCQTCAFYRIDPKNLKQGTCRFNPPQVFPVPMGQNIGAVSFVPNVDETFWCGKWKAKIWN